ncbi:tannase/feruloyl esterase family alpha/beta hydrolase [Croceibacterium aestuarii]|uniref:tannase/feruloyl esterase family alpha/beta hydrolase n=1 Tax=Croceibacterium aestuarii TaxID=3064139 RepID=UPI00272E5A34|nr:tannase/feruloyl esterase family alpha/beta hydrolase [Croceibacterium sp. D39]
MRLTASIAAAALLAAGCATDTSQPSGAITYNGVKDCAAFNVAGLGLADAKTTWVPGKDALPSYCEVSGTLHPVAGSDIGVVYRLPEAWNRKVYGVGGGGWIGNTALQTVTDALRRGYATMSTDGGHPIGNVWDNSWAVMPEKAKDFSYRAIHEMTAAGKKVAAAYYGKKHSRAYYVGCSTGGRMGLMEAQRFPADYDAIVAGAPVYTLQVQTSSVLRTNVFTQSGGLSAGDLKLAENAALAQCDADDGLKDGLINDPRSCHWDPATIQCSGAKTDSCLSAPQVAALKTVYEGIKSPDGEWAMLPMSRGGETTWSFFVATDGKGKDPTQGGGLVGLGPVIFPGRTVDWAHFSAATDVPQVRSSAFAAMYEAKDPNLSPFFQRGGKLLMWHGLSDAGPSPVGSTDYARAVMAQNKAAADQYRLFLAPGVGHCGGGPGADVLPLLDTIETWDRTDVAPETVVASKRDSPLKRLDCAWPKVAHYKGSGDANDPASWSCAAPTS